MFVMSLLHADPVRFASEEAVNLWKEGIEGYGTG